MDPLLLALIAPLILFNGLISHIFLKCDLLETLFLFLVYHIEV